MKFNQYLIAGLASFAFTSQSFAGPQAVVSFETDFTADNSVTEFKAIVDGATQMFDLQGVFGLNNWRHASEINSTVAQGDT